MLGIIITMIDKEIFPWLNGKKISTQQRMRSASIVADRLTGVLSDPIIRNAQEKRQFATLSHYLESKGYKYLDKCPDIYKMEEKTYSLHSNVPVYLNSSKSVNMPIDLVVKPDNKNKYPLLVECKSAGDFTNEVV